MLDLSSVQLLFVGTVLAWAGTVKVTGRSSAAGGQRSVLAKVVGADRAGVTLRAVGAVELALAAVLLAPPVQAGEAVAAGVLCAGFLGYLGYARVAAPDASCGCLAATHAPVRWRAFARVGLLGLASAAAVAAIEPWHRVLAARPAAAVGLLAAELTAFVALSTELDRLWLRPLRRLRTRLWPPPDGSTAEVPVASTVEQLQRSPAYRELGRYLRSEVVETWDTGAADGDAWRLLTYTAEYAGQRATAVFAVPRRRYAPDEIRYTVVDETTRTTLLPNLLPNP